MSDLKKDHGVSYEHTDLGAKGIVKTIVIMFATIVAVYIVCAILAKVMNVRSTNESVSEALPPGPRLEVDGPAGLRALRQTEESLLNTYAWVDQSKGIVRIPIDRAMKLTTERGLPAREKTNS